MADSKRFKRRVHTGHSKYILNLNLHDSADKNPASVIQDEMPSFTPRQKMLPKIITSFSANQVKISWFEKEKFPGREDFRT